VQFLVFCLIMKLEVHAMYYYFIACMLKMGDFESDTQIEMMKIVQAMHNYE